MARCNYVGRNDVEGTIMRMNLKLAGITAFFLVSCLLSVGEASTVTLTQFLEALETRPELAAVAATVEAAEANLAQAQNPVALDLSFSSNASATEPSPFADTRVGVGVTAYPFLRYGQPGDVLRLREIDLERARVDQEEVRAQLEASAFENALALELSQEALGLARSSAEAAVASFNAEQLRFDRGLTTGAELRGADAGQQRVRNLVLNAEADVQLTRTTLGALVGDVQLGSVPSLAAPSGVLKTPAVRRAELDLAAAQVGQAGATRPFYPVAELSYDYNVSNQNRLSASVNSSDLAPRVGYSFDYDGYGEDPRLSLRVSATLAPEQFDNVTRLEALVKAAEAALAAAQQNAAVGEAQLRTRLSAAQREQILAALVFNNAEQNLSEVRRREALGAGTPLETQAAVVALAEAGLDARDARQGATAALLDLYRFFGLPLSTTLPTDERSTEPSTPAAPDLETP